MPGGKKNAGKTIKRLLSYIQEENASLRWFLCVIINTIAMLAGSYMLRPIINSLTSENGSADKLTAFPGDYGVYLCGGNRCPIFAVPRDDWDIPACYFKIKK